jgi:capsular exopolysaccharide synthesis family protein
MLPNPGVREVSIYDYIKVIQKRLTVIIALLIIIPLAVAIIDFTTKPVYRATVSILIGKTPPKVTKIEEVYQTSPRDEQQYYATQYKILASRALAERAFEELRLAKDYEYRDKKDAVGFLRNQITIEPVKDSQIVLIHVSDGDALRASRIANAVAKVYIQQDIEMRNMASRAAVGFLDKQLVELKRKVQESEEALNKYVQQNKIVTLSDIEQKTQGLLDNLKRERLALETELADNLKRYKEKHPKIISLQAQLEDTKNKIEEETNLLLELNQKMVQYNILKREVDSNQQIYVSMLSMAKETGVSEKLEVSSIYVIDAARPPSVPFKPQTKRDVLLSVVIAIFCGLGFAFILEYLDASIRTAEDVRIYLDLPFLGYVPSVTEARSDTEKALVVHQHPTSVITESFRAVRTSILFAFPQDRPLKTILVTAAVPEEGKSFFSANLSQVFSQLNERVILIDIDMRKPKLYKSFGLEQKNGLSNFLAGSVAMEAIIKPTLIKNLSLVTSGTIPPNPSELLSSGKIHSLLDELKTKFDRIIVDSPPILSVADASLLANMVDGVVLVLKGGSTRMEAVVKAKEKILEAKGKIIGVVVNNISPQKEDRYYYYHYYYSEGSKHK